MWLSCCNFLKSLNGKPNPFIVCPAPRPCQTLFNFAQTLPQENPYNSYDVTERTISALWRVDVLRHQLDGNAGVRVVRTNTTASTAEAAPDLAVDAATVGSTQTWNVQYASTQPVGYQGPIHDPAAFREFQLLGRAGSAAAAICGWRRPCRAPNSSYLAPTSTNNAINGQPQLYYNGTAGLKPIKANQVDFSAEWYYHPHSALTAGSCSTRKFATTSTPAPRPTSIWARSSVSGGPPGTVPCTPFPWTVYAPANGASSDFYGIELAWQHIMDNGFGAHAQYTHTWNKSYRSEWQQNRADQ